MVWHPTVNRKASGSSPDLAEILKHLYLYLKTIEMKKSSKITKKQSNKKSTKDSEHNNPQDKRIYIDSSDAEVTIGYDLLKQTRYIQINSIN